MQRIIDYLKEKSNIHDDTEVVNSFIELFKNDNFSLVSKEEYSIGS